MQEDIERREAMLEEHTLNLSRRDEVHSAHKDLRESVYQAEMTSLQEQKRVKVLQIKSMKTPKYLRYCAHRQWLIATYGISAL